MTRRKKRDSENNPFEIGFHATELKRLAIQSIKSYFSDKRWYVGGPIPERDLLSESSITTVLRTPFNEKTFEFVHEHCLPSVPEPDWYDESSVPWTVSYLISLLESMVRAGVPKEFQPGLLLLHFKFCHGISFNNLK